MTFMPKQCAEKKVATSGDISGFPSSIVVLVAIVEENPADSLTVETASVTSLVICRTGVLKGLELN